jgi:hypothetical protein
MRKHLKKLELHRETLLGLADTRLRRAAAGVPASIQTCGTPCTKGCTTPCTYTCHYPCIQQ